MDLSSPRETMESGLNIVQNAYQTQVSILKNEINRLNKELEVKASTIKELEIFSQQLLIDNKKLHQQKEFLLEENNKIKSSNGIGLLHKPLLNDNNIAQNLKRKNMLKKNLLFSTQNQSTNVNNLSIDPPVIKNISIETPKMTLTSIKQKDNSFNSKSNKLIAVPSEKSIGNISSSQLSSEFIKKSKETLMHNEYLQLIDIVKKSNAKFITKQDTFNRITILLQNKYHDLYSDFKEIFSL